MVQKTLFPFLIFILLFSCRSADQAVNPEVQAEKSAEPASIRPETAGPTVLSPQVMMDRTHFLTGSEQEIFLMVKFAVPEQEMSETRPDLSLSMVLDRSGSMSSEGKMENSLDAAAYGATLLRPGDQLAVVEYDDIVTTLWPLSKVTSPQMVQEIIRTLAPRGGTNLCGGMNGGIAELKRDSSESLKRVILLSDGLANQGVVNPEAIASYARDAYRSGITVSTMGVGLDYNEDLMQAIAEAGGGNYFFIEDPAQIKELFAREMAGLFQTVAQNITLAVEGTEVVSSLSVVGEKKAVKKISSLYGGAEQTVLFKIKLKSGRTGKTSLGKLKIAYSTPQSEKREELIYNLVLTGTADSSVATGSVEKPVLAEAALIEAEELHEESIRLYEAGRKEEALAQISTKNSELKSLNSVLNDKRLGSKIEAFEMEKSEMKEAEQSVQNHKRYLKRSKSRSYNSKKGNIGFMFVGSGSSKNDVLRIQKQLKAKGYYSGELNGVYSPEMTEAVKKFQKDQGITVDGSAGPMTQKKLGLY